MENDKEQEELLAEFLLVETMVRENPCGMPKSVMSSLKSILRDFIGKHCIEGATREQVARYFGKDVRTINRWKNDYPDFPEGKVAGRKEATYHWNEIIKWKLEHKELFAY